jgi:hypothetical protein
MDKIFVIGGENFIMRYVQMGIYEIITPTKNSLRFANKDKALEHIAFLEARHGKK